MSNLEYNIKNKRKKQKRSDYPQTRNLQTELAKRIHCAMVAYKQDDVVVAKHPPKVDCTDGQASAGKGATRTPIAVKPPQGVGHDTLGSKAFAGAEASDNGDKSSAVEEATIRSAAKQLHGDRP
jgi:hypothetical protein